MLRNTPGSPPQEALQGRVRVRKKCLLEAVALARLLEKLDLEHFGQHAPGSRPQPSDKEPLLPAGQRHMTSQWHPREAFRPADGDGVQLRNANPAQVTAQKPALQQHIGGKGERRNRALQLCNMLAREKRGHPGGVADRNRLQVAGLTLDYEDACCRLLAAPRTMTQAARFGSSTGRRTRKASIKSACEEGFDSAPQAVGRQDSGMEERKKGSIPSKHPGG